MTKGPLIQVVFAAGCAQFQLYVSTFFRDHGQLATGSHSAFWQANPPEVRKFNTKKIKMFEGIVFHAPLEEWMSIR